MATTWSTTDKVASVVLSGNNLIATAVNDAAATFQSGRSTVAVTSGQKKFWSLKVTVLPTASGNVALGISTAAFAFASFLGSDLLSGASYFNNGIYFVNNTNKGTAVAWVLNSVVDCALDRSNNTVWIRIDGGNWNNSGAADPATNTGGFDVSGIVADVFPTYELLGDAGGTGSVTANFGATVFPFAIPSGFTSFDDALLGQAVM